MITLLEVCNGEISNGVFNDPGKRDGTYLLVNVLDMFGTDQIQVSSLRWLSLEREEFEKNKVKYGDIFFTRSSLVPAGIAWSNVFLSHEENVTYDGHLMKISPDLGRFSPAYLAQYFRSRPVRKQLIIRGKTGTMTTIGQADIATVELVVPALAEQQKIADFLTAVDKRIQQLSQKKALLEDYKKGVMQQLFTQALRFKDDHGNEFPDWEETTLGDISCVITSGSRDWAQFYSETGSLFIRMTNLPRNGIYLLLDDLKYVSLPKNGHEGARTSLQTHDILISITAELGKIGWVPENLGEAFINQHTALVRPIRGAVDSKFIAYSLANPETNVRINRLNDSGAKSGLNLSTIRAFNLLIPSLPEQTKIANFLTALDRKIETVSAQITHTQTFKKGLLQQMFV